MIKFVIFLQDGNKLTMKLCSLVPLYEERLMVKVCQVISVWKRKQMVCLWVKVFRIIPEFRILRLTFHRIQDFEADFP